MPDTVVNPIAWAARKILGAGEYTADAARAVGTDRSTAEPVVREIGLADIREALGKGYRDAMHFRGDVLFIVVLYPVIGLILAGVGLNMDLLPLLFPLLAGFAIVGPLAATGLYQMSRLREAGKEAGWGDAVRVIGSPAFPALVVMGLYLIGLFVAWLMVAALVHSLTLGPEQPASIGAFLGAALTTPEGWAMILIGCAVGAVFAAAAISISIVSFPLLLDRDVGVPQAIATSVAVARKNPRTVAIWGAIVAALLVLGAIPALIGLVLVMPVLGHATWHLYRRAVE
ncbi:DUF2189 domain-containing protein [Anianabacter salinae]|uniref:DUF2189 domain-containing protein n=1 Tax=Anianabacter salinae TaxID=2851023 RepID=UPI00225E55BC|nr:DUF2189 domain-containing protein [Anianabacter salinae]MBV0910808.1 DUF2189 domain-containing protein [Anianabacter salinae]